MIGDAFSAAAQASALGVWSDRSPSATIVSMSSGRGLCSFRASSVGALSHTSYSSGVVRITGIALGWIGPTTPFGSDVKNEYSRCSPSTGSAFVPRAPVHGRQMPANAARGRSSFSANQTGIFRGLVSRYSEKEVRGIRARYCGLSQARQNGDETFRTFVTGWLPTFGGGGKPQRIWISSRSPSWVRTTGAIWSGKIDARGGRCLRYRE
jgi:hypothetical protein